MKTTYFGLQFDPEVHSHSILFPAIALEGGKGSSAKLLELRRPCKKAFRRDVF